MRPAGVVLIALYHFLSGAALLLVAIWLVKTGSADIAKFSGGFYSRAEGMELAAVVFVLAAVIILVGYSIWTLREWGRILCIVLAAMWVLYSLPGLLHGPYPLGFYRYGFDLARTALNVLILWYLMRPRIKPLFQRTGSALSRVR